jgi:hypothetical protein
MRSKSVNTMSTRRARRPDGRTYREMRKRTGLGRRGGATWVVAVVVIALAVIAWMFFR